MKQLLTLAGICALVLMGLGALIVPGAAAQDPILTPVVVGEAAPIVAKVLQPKQKQPGLAKFEGYILNSNVAQVTVKAKGNDMAIRTFPLNQTVAAKMQKIIDKGGFQYGDKITVYYDPQTLQALKIKGKPSRPL
jgi:hypothetical protein